MAHTTAIQGLYVKSGDTVDDLATLNGTCTSTTASAGAWDQRTASAAHTKLSNENAFTSQTATMTGAAGSFKLNDVAQAKAYMKIEARDDTGPTPAVTTGVQTDIYADSAASRTTPAATNDNLVSSSAYINNGVVNTITRERTGTNAAYTQISGTTDSIANGWGFGAGSSLRAPAAGTVLGGTNQVYAGMEFTAQANMYQGAGPTFGPKLTSTLKTGDAAALVAGAVANTIQGAKYTSTTKIQDTAGAYGTMRNFQMAVTDPTAWSSLFSTGWDTQWAEGWAQGADPSTELSSWQSLNTLAFNGLQTQNKKVGFISQDETRIDGGVAQVNPSTAPRQALSIFSTTNDYSNLI